DAEIHRDAVHHRLHHAEAGDGETAQQAVALMLVTRFRGIAIQRAGTEAERIQRGEQGRQRHLVLAPAQHRAAVHGIEADVAHAVALAERLLDQPAAGSAADVIELQAGLVHAAIEARKARQHIGRVEGLPARRVGRLHPGRKLGAETVEIIHAGGKDELRHCFATGTTERPALAIDFQPALLALGYRLAAVEAVVHFMPPNSMSRSVALSRVVTRQPLLSSAMRTYQRPGRALPTLPRCRPAASRCMTMRWSMADC